MRLGLRLCLMGVLDLALYEQASVKIMWILKQDREDCQDGMAYAERIRGAAKEQRIQSSPTWAPIAYASYAILNGVEEFESIPDANECAEAMLSTALVEIQKELGDSSTPNQIVRDGYAKYGDLLARQIKAADPDVIIVCLPEGLKDIVLSIRKDVFSLDDNDWNWGACASALCGKKLLLWAWHPSQRRNFENGVWTDDPAMITSLEEQFDSVWRGDFCKDCGRKDYCTGPIV